MKTTLLASDASIQEVVSEEETQSNTKKGDLNHEYTDNLQEKEDFTKITPKDQVSESTKANPNPLISLLSPPLKVVCFKLMSKYPEIMRDIDKWILLLRSFMLEHIVFVMSQLQSKGKEDHLTLFFDEFLSTLIEVDGMGFNVEWLVSCVMTLIDLKKAGPSVHASLFLLQQLRVKRNSCINKVEKTKSTMEVHSL